MCVLRTFIPLTLSSISVIVLDRPSFSAASKLICWTYLIYLILMSIVSANTLHTHTINSIEPSRFSKCSVYSTTIYFITQNNNYFTIIVLMTSLYTFVAKGWPWQLGCLILTEFKWHNKSNNRLQTINRPIDWPIDRHNQAISEERHKLIYGNKHSTTSLRNVYA